MMASECQTSASGQPDIEAARDPAVHTDRITVEPSLGDAHSSVRERVEQIVEAAHENGVLQDIQVEEMENRYQSVAVHISAREDWGAEGQRGFDSAHIVLGPRGALKIGTIRSVMTGSREYDRFRSLKSAIERMG